MKENIETCDARGINLVAPLHPSVNGYRHENDGFIYNKNAQSVTCAASELAVKKSFNKANPKKKNNAHYDYYFYVEKCKQCHLKEGYYKERAKHKTYSIRILPEEYQWQKVFQTTLEFKRDIRIRNRIERKNSELKDRY